MLAEQLEACDPYTSGHSRRVSRYSALVGSRLGLPGDALLGLRTAATLHDVGKIYVPREILHKRGPLTPAEFARIREHAAEGAALIEEHVGDASLRDIVRHHHERVDGGGYPDQLGAHEIPLGARIVAVADTFDAIASRRPYRPARSAEEALGLLRTAAGTQLDGDIVEVFCAQFKALPGLGDRDLPSDAGWRAPVCGPRRAWARPGVLTA